jgi:DNA-binding response OmpR family regulator
MVQLISSETYLSPKADHIVPKILLIDDDIIYGALISEHAMDFDCECDVICSPDDLEFVVDSDYDLILLDYQLGPFNGLQVAPLVADFFGRTPIVLISSNTDIAEIQTSLPEVFEFLPKSIAPREIIKKSIEIIRTTNLRH